MSSHRDEIQATKDRTSTLVVVMIASFLAPFMMSALNVALPDIGAEFELSAVALSWVVTSNVLPAAMLMMPMGRLADMRGRRAVFLPGMAVFTIGALIAGLSPYTVGLYAGRVVNGIGASMVFSTSTAIVMSVVTPGDRGRVLGWNIATVYLGLSVGPVIGGLIAHAFGWRWIFLLSAVTGIATTILAVRHLRPDRQAAQAEARFDYVGSLMLGSSLASFLAGCTLLPGATGLVLLFAGFTGVLLFLKWELRCADPIFDVRSFKGNAVFLFSNAAALINYAATAATGFLLSLYLAHVKGFSLSHTGAVLVAQPLVMTIASPVTGRLSDRVDPGRLASVGMAVSAAGLLLFAFIGAETPIWWIVTGLCVLGTGFGLFSSPNTNAVMSSVDRHHYGTASSTLSTMRLTGQMASMAIVTLIEAILLGTTKLGAHNAAAYLRCMRLAFLIFFGLCVVGVFASAVRGRLRGGATAN